MIEDIKKILRQSFFYRQYKKIVSMFFCIIYKCSVKKIKFIWITWTDWKTTTSELVYHILKQAWFKVWIMTTISLDIWKWKQKNPTKNKLTTMTPKDFHKYIFQAYKNWLEYFVLETSSHSLYQYRVFPVKFSAVAITNLTHEHLDMHKTMEKYFLAKSELFYFVKKDSIWIYPKNFQYYKKLKSISKVSKLLSFSVDDKNSDIFADQIEQKPFLKAQINIDSDSFFIETKMIWLFNLENILIAIGIANYIWVWVKDIISWIKIFESPWWRVQIIHTKKWVDVVIDFALTPNALEKLYWTFQNLWYKKLIAVLWATWDRDKKKRPIMWKIAISYNDFSIFTEDENYSEDWKKILEDIVSEIIDKKKYKIIQDRKKAIEYSLTYASKWDVVLITGMGNFTSRKMWDKQIEWSDEKVVQDFLEKTL